VEYGRVYDLDFLDCIPGHLAVIAHPDPQDTGVELVGIHHPDVIRLAEWAFHFDIL
jgi:hypothetical protein